MSGGGEGRAGIRVRVNEAPAPGICQVCVAGLQDCVQAGLALVDSFVMACSMFPDGDKPLSYRFGFAYDNGRTWFDSTFASRFTFSTSHRLLALVSDSLGASSPYIQVEVNAQATTAPGTSYLAIIAEARDA